MVVSWDQGFNPARRRLLTGVAAGLAAQALPLGAKAACMLGDAQPNPHGWRVFRVANPPSGNAASVINNYTSWPCTDAVSGQSGSTTSTWTGGGAANNWPINSWFYVWANRSAPTNQSVIGPNPIQSPIINHPTTGNECRVNYTTIQKANAATQSLIRYWLGRADYMAPWLGISGTSASDFVYYDQLVANPKAYFTSIFAVGNAHQSTSYNVMTDRPWLPSAPVSKTNPNGLFQRATMMPGQGAYQDAPGVVLDYEVGDGRTTGVGASASDPNGALNFIKTLYNDIHASADSHGNVQRPGQLVLFTDGLNAPSMKNSGLDVTNLYMISANYVDLMSVQLWGQNPEGNVAKSYQNQIALLTAGALARTGKATIPYSKLFIVFDVAGTSLSDAQFTYNLLKQGSTSSPQSAPKAVWFWDDGAALCGSTLNTQISAVLKGCSAAATVA